MGRRSASTAHTGAISTSTNPLQIGGDSLYGQFFAGLIDDVRVYNVALTAAQIQTDETTAVNPQGPDTTPPTQPGTLTATAVSGTEIDLSWGASTDNVGVTGYDIERCQGAGCTNFAQIATATGTTSYKDTSVIASTSYTYRVRATRRRRQPQPLLQHRQRHHPDARHQPADTARDAERDLGLERRGRSLLGRLDGQRRRNGLRHRALPGHRLQQLHPDRHGAGTATTYKDTTVSASTSYTYRVRATDAAGNLSPYSNTASVTTSAAPSGLVAAYGFDEGSGTTVTDASGNGNNGTVANATWSTAGKFGEALSFNGTSSLVTIPNSASLQLSSGMTLEAWVDPSTVNANWRDVIYKANDNFYLEATSTNASQPDAGLIAGGSYADAFGTAALPANTWSFLTETYDGSTLRLYVNGTQVASTAHTGAIATSTNPLQIGGDSHLRPVLRRPDRQRPDLQRRADRRADPDRRDHRRQLSGRGHHPTVAAGNVDRVVSHRAARSISGGVHRPTTSASPATTSSAARGAAAAISPRLRARTEPPRTTPTRASAPTTVTPIAYARPTPPAISARTPTASPCRRACSSRRASTRSRPG